MENLNANFTYCIKESINFINTTYTNICNGDVTAMYNGDLFAVY